MVEDEIATFLVDNAGYTKGTDLWLNVLPEETREGVAVRIIRQEEIDGHLVRAYVAIFAFYYEYPIARSKMDAISAALDDRRGSSDGTWSVAGPVESQALGPDNLARNVLVVTFPVTFTYDKV